LSIVGDDKVERRKRLHLVDDGGDYATAESAESDPDADPGPVPDVADSAEKHDASTVIGNAVMYAAMSWVACCMEKSGAMVSVAALGGGLFGAEVTFAEGGSFFLRVTLALEHGPGVGPGVGPRLRTVVEPIHP
jgi:hypothetical protein